MNEITKYFIKGAESMKEIQTREEIIAWITEQLRKLPLGYLYQVRGFVHGFLK